MIQNKIKIKIKPNDKLSKKFSVAPRKNQFHFGISLGVNLSTRATLRDLLWGLDLIFGHCIFSKVSERSFSSVESPRLGIHLRSFDFSASLFSPFFFLSRT